MLRDGIPEGGAFSGGAKAHTEAFHREIFEFVVRRLRTTHRKLSGTNSAVCAFAPPEKALPPRVPSKSFSKGIRGLLVHNQSLTASVVNP